MLNTLYVTSPDMYMRLDGENVVIRQVNSDIARIPLHNLESIVTFGYTGASPGLMGACAKRDISICFLTQNGRFLARSAGEMRGNVLLRKEQYRISDEEVRCVSIAKNMIIGKVYNSKWVLERVTRDHPLQVDVDRIKAVTTELQTAIKQLMIEINSLDRIRGIEGNAASRYFSVANELIIQQKETFFLKERNRRPPLDNVNAMLSFLYTILTNECAAALSSVGLDPYVGFLHRDRPGRVSLALDLMEELRPICVDRFVVTLINRRIVGADDFVKKENGAVIMTDKCRKKILTFWQEKKKEIIKHPFLDEKIEWGLVPHVQALLLARYIRGDLEAYPPFMWK